VDHLEVPEALAGAGVESEEAITEKTDAGTVGTVEIIGWGAEGKVGDAALFIDGDFAPGVDAAEEFPGVFGEGFVAEFAGVGDGVELPGEFAGEDIVGAEVAGAERKASPGAEPRMRRFSKILPGLLDWMRLMVLGSRPRPCLRSTTPLVPKVRMDLPVLASISWIPLLISKMRRRSLWSLLSQ